MPRLRLLLLALLLPLFLSTLLATPAVLAGNIGAMVELVIVEVAPGQFLEKLFDGCGGCMLGGDLRGMNDLVQNLETRLAAFRLLMGEEARKGVWREVSGHADMPAAIEAVIERYGPEHHELAGRAKDMGSAAVFVLMMNVLLCWALILAPRYL